MLVADDACIAANATRLVSPNMVAILVTNALLACGIGEDARPERVGDARDERHM